MNDRRWIDPESGAPERLRAALAEFDAEPSAHSRARGWARFSDPKTRRTSRPGARWQAALGGALAGAALAAAALALVPARSPPADVTAVELEGQVLGDRGVLAAGARLETPAAIRVGPVGRAVLETSAGDTLRIGSSSRVELQRRAHTHIELLAGSVDVEASPRTQGDRLVVVAEPWRVEVVGTRFTVERGPHDGLRVAVAEGRVRVVGPDYDDVLGPGDAFDSSRRSEHPGAVGAQAALSPKSESPDPEPGASGRRTRADPGVEPKAPSGRVPRPSAGGAAARSPGTMPDAVTRSQSRETPPTMPRSNDPAEPGARLGPNARSSDRAATEVEQARPTEEGASREASPNAEPEVLDPALDQVAAYRAARALKDAGRNAEAAARYAELITRWPEGELNQVAYLDRIECLLDDGQVDLARRTEQTFMRAHPAAASRPEVCFMRAEVARALGTHARAAELYAAAARADRFAESAGFLEALSHARAGDTAKAQNLMGAYLERFPNGVYADEARRALRENGR